MIRWIKNHPRMSWIMRHARAWHGYWYYFMWKRSYQFPAEITIEISNQCNLACVFCPRQHFDGFKKWKKNNMKMELFTKLIDEIAEKSPKTMIYLHKDGEVFAHPKLFDMINYAKNKGLYVSFHTNGILMNEKNIPKLLETKLDAMIISVNATDSEDYKKTMQTNDWDKLMYNIDYLRAAMYAVDSKLKVSLLVVNTSAKKTAKFLDQWEGKFPVIVNQLRNWGGVVKGIEGEKTTEPKRRPCLALYIHPAINYDGTVMACCQMFGFLKKGVIGNVNDNTIEDVWLNSPLLNDLRKQHLMGKVEFPICKNCNSWTNYLDIWKPPVTKRMIKELRKKMDKIRYSSDKKGFLNE